MATADQFRDDQDQEHEQTTPMLTERSVITWIGSALVSLGGYFLATDTAQQSTGLPSPQGAVGWGAIVLGLVTVALPSYWRYRDRRDQREEARRRREEERADRRLQEQFDAAKKEAERSRAEAQAAKKDAEEAHRQIEDLRGRVGAVEDRSGELRTAVANNRTVLAGHQGSLDGLAELVAAGWAKGPTPRGRSGLPPTVLVVEDNPGLLQTIARFFSANHFAVTSAATLEQALAVLDKQPHWAIVDVRLGADNGFDVLKYVREHNLSTKVIITTGVIDEDVERRRQELKARFVEEKPLDLDKILKLMAEHAGDGPVLMG